MVTADLDSSDHASKHVLIQDLVSTWHDSFNLDMVSVMWWPAKVHHHHPVTICPTSQVIMVRLCTLLYTAICVNQEWSGM